MKKFILFSLLVCCLCSCSDDDHETVSRRFPCHFDFHTEWHPASMITTALKTYNYYVRIGMTANSGAYTVIATDQRDSTEHVRLTNDLENYPYRSGIYLGAGGSGGTILFGQTNFSGYVAWDGQCPNCATGYTTKYQLQWTDNITSVHCNTCNRTYSLETGAILDGAKGDALLGYIVGINGTVLSIGN